MVITALVISYQPPLVLYIYIYIYPWPFSVSHSPGNLFTLSNVDERHCPLDRHPEDQLTAEILLVLFHSYPKLPGR